MIINKWPSKEHPYLVHLFYQLKRIYPGLILYQYSHSNDYQFAEELIGKDGVSLMKRGALYRFDRLRNPGYYFKPLFCWIKNIAATYRFYRNLRFDGYSRYRALGQLLYCYELIGKEFDLVYINALQIARHIPVRALFPETPVACSSRGQDFDFAEVGYYDKILSTLDFLHVLGIYLADKACSRGFPRERITIIPPAVLPVHLKLPAYNTDKKESITIVSVSRAFWSKGYIYALRAVSNLVKRLKDKVQIKYTIIGDGSEVDFIKVEVDRLGLTDVVDMKGWVTQREIDNYLLGSDIYLLLSIEEGFNNSVMQAQQLGLPCVVSDAGGLPENVLHEKTGFVVPRYNAKIATEYLYKLTLDQELRKSMGEQGKIRMQSVFGLSVQVEKYSAFFQKIITG